MVSKSGILATLLLTFNGITQAGTPPEPAGPQRATGAITYVERPEGGKYKVSGRKLSTNGRLNYGVDINSQIDIQIDKDKLGVALLQSAEKTEGAQRARDLTERLRKLQEAASTLDAENEAVKALFGFWNGAQQGGTAEQELFRQKLRESATRRSKLLSTLQEVMQARLEDGGLSAQAAEDNSKRAFNPVLIGPNLIFGYDWIALGKLFEQEIQFAGIELENLKPTLGIAIEIQGHFFPKSGDGQPVPVFLPGYNQAAVGPESRFEKLKFAVSDSEKKLFEEFEKTATTIESTRSAAKGLLNILETQYADVRASLKELTAAAKEAFGTSRSKIEKLRTWASAEKRAEWLKKVKASLEASPEGNRVISEWNALEAIFSEFQEDIDGIEAYARLDDSLAGQSAPEALDSILRVISAIRARDPRAPGLRVVQEEVWKRRFEAVDRFVNAVNALKSPLLEELKKDGPYADLVEARDALKDFVAVVKGSASAVVSWLGQVFFAVPSNRATADLPTPPGQKQLAVFGSEGLDTTVNLLTIPAKRDAGDTLRIQYRFSDGEAELANIGWVDTFRLEVYGWQSQALASMALAKQKGDPTWKPNAAINWILSHHGWPSELETGLGSGGGLHLFSGVGMSAMPLNSPGVSGIELGIGPSLSFFNNRFLAGYGFNLQREDNKGFWFISVRLVSIPALSGPLSAPGR
jgi:hypothetical protein